MADDPERNGERPLLVDYGPVQLCVYGEGREALGRRIMNDIGVVQAKALEMLTAYLGGRFQNPDDFFLEGVEVHAARTADGDFLLYFSHEREREEFADTLFEVGFVNNEPLGEPYWPFRFTVRYR